MKDRIATSLPFHEQLATLRQQLARLHSDRGRRQQAEQALRRGQARVLELLGTGKPLSDVLDALLETIEGQKVGMLGSILLYDEEENALRHGSAPSLPREYTREIDGIVIGPTVGSCGTAAYFKRRTIVEDVMSDPLWSDYRELARTHGFRACWSQPILTSDGRLLGTFAMYYPNPQLPTDDELELIQTGAHLAGIAIESRQSERELRNSEERFRQLTEHIRGVVWLTDWRKQKILYVSSSYQTIWGRSCESLYEDPGSWADNIHPDDKQRVRKAFAQRAENGDFDEEYRIVRDDGELRWIHDRAFPIEDADGNAYRVAGISEDITDRKLAEEEARELEKKLRQTQKIESLGILAGGIAHDFNNLLVGILANAELAGRDLPQGSQAHQRLGRVRKAAERAAELCDQMLAYAGQGELSVVSLDLNEEVKDISHLLEVSISKKTELRYDFASELPHIEGGATQIRQVIMNLITNAAEAIGDAGGTITVATGSVYCDQADLRDSYLETQLPEGLYVYLEVSDTGCGMDQETLARIFDPFFTTRFTGRGLGLAALLGILGGHKGTVRVRTEPGKGSTFTLLFPSLEHSVGPDILAGPVQDGRKTVLVVEDEEMVLEVARDFLEADGFRVVPAVDGLQAMELFRQSPDDIDCVLLDMLMPRMDGEQTARELRRIRSDIPIVVTSGYSERKITNRFAGAGVAGFLKKPYSGAQLIGKVNEALKGTVET